jgi:ABC-type uncharacterized transport system permease subunit
MLINQKFNFTDFYILYDLFKMGESCLSLVLWQYKFSIWFGELLGPVCSILHLCVSIVIQSNQIAQLELGI